MKFQVGLNENPDVRRQKIAGLAVVKKLKTNLPANGSLLSPKSMNLLDEATVKVEKMETLLSQSSNVPHSENPSKTELKAPAPTP